MRELKRDSTKQAAYYAGGSAGEIHNGDNQKFRAVGYLNVMISDKDRHIQLVGVDTSVQVLHTSQALHPGLDVAGSEGGEEPGGQLTNKQDIWIQCYITAIHTITAVITAVTILLKRYILKTFFIEVL